MGHDCCECFLVLLLQSLVLALDDRVYVLESHNKGWLTLVGYLFDGHLDAHSRAVCHF